MTTNTQGAADLFALIEAYAELRHKQGYGSYNANTYAAWQAVKDAIAGKEATLLRELAAYRITVENLEREIAAQQPAPSAAVALSDDLRDRLVAISEAVADQDDRAAQAMLREILKAPQANTQPAPSESQQPAPSAAPAGWKLGEPITEAMHVAALKVLHRATGNDGLPQRMLNAMLAAAPTAQADTQPAPVLWVSPEQFANFVDTDEAPFGKYIPARKTSAGKFTMSLFAARAPAPAQPVAEPAQPAPVLWLSPEQFANFVDADEAPFGKYVPARKTSAGKFTMPLFAARAPAESVPAPPPPPECETEAEKRAFAFGWFKALESERMKADTVQEDAARLDWLDQQREAYGFQDIHEGNRWEISGAYANVREAIDAARKQGTTP